MKMDGTINAGTGAPDARRLADLAALLERTARDFAPAALASSFSAEDMVLIDRIARDGPDIEIFMLDTGRLHEETHALVAEVRRRYGIAVRSWFPDAAAVEALVTAHGPNSFYDSVSRRHECCAIRKVEPLRRALAGKRAWITGQRRAQATTRRDLPVEEWDAANGLHKVNPLAAWSTGEVWSYIRAFDVPYNALYDLGFASIGCAPCTRAISAGEDIRAGRWWWENPEGRECGLHANDGVRRAGEADNAA